MNGGAAILSCAAMVSIRTDPARRRPDLLGAIGGRHLPGDDGNRHVADDAAGLPKGRDPGRRSSGATWSPPAAAGPLDAPAGRPTPSSAPTATGMDAPVLAMVRSFSALVVGEEVERFRWRLLRHRPAVQATRRVSVTALRAAGDRGEGEAAADIVGTQAFLVAGIGALVGFGVLEARGSSPPLPSPKTPSVCGHVAPR